MFGFITNFLHGLTTLVMLSLLGALVGLGCALINRVVGGVQGYAIAAAAGAVMMVGAHFGGVLGTLASDAAKQEIADLKAKNIKLAHDAAAAKAAAEKEEALAAAAIKHAEALDKQMLEAEKIIAKHADDKDCGLSAEELDAIRKIK